MDEDRKKDSDMGFRYKFWHIIAVMRLIIYNPSSTLEEGEFEWYCRFMERHGFPQSPPPS